MNATELLSALASDGVSVDISDDGARLRVTGRASAIEARAHLLRAQKPALLSLLAPRRRRPNPTARALWEVTNEALALGWTWDELWCEERVQGRPASLYEVMRADFLTAILSVRAGRIEVERPTILYLGSDCPPWGRMEARSPLSFERWPRRPRRALDSTGGAGGRALYPLTWEAEE